MRIRWPASLAAHPTDAVPNLVTLATALFAFTDVIALTTASRFRAVRDREGKARGQQHNNGKISGSITDDLVAVT
jgi:hypothetical protein